MNKLVVPPSPNWYESSILLCTPDNTLIYGARHDLVFLENTEDPNQPAKIRLIPKAHSQKVVCVHINKNWGKPFKHLVSASEDKIIKVWNAENLEKISSHNAHLDHNKLIGVNFAGDDKIVSVSEDGIIIIWALSTNSLRELKDVFGFKVTVTCISSCPHASWLTAFGLKNGLVVVTDLRKSGTLLYKLRGHDKSVVSLSWCPAPVNIFPKNPLNYVGVKKADSEGVSTESTKKDETNQSSSESKVENEDENITNPLLTASDSEDVENSPLYQDLMKAISEKETIEEVATKDISDIIDSVSTTETSIDNSNVEESMMECQGYECVIEKIDTQNVNPPMEVSNSEQQSTRLDLPGKESDKTQEIEQRVINPERISVEEESRKEFLLASSAKEGNIYIWRAGTDGRMQTFMSLPTTSKGRRKAPEKIWITLCWASPTTLLSSSKYNELIQWTLPKPLDSKNLKHMTVVHKDNNTTLFSIAAPLIYGNEYNWSKMKATNAWTVSQDRLLLNTSLEVEKKNLNFYTTFGGPIYCLKLSPLDPNRLALGSTDGLIRVWDLSRPHVRQVMMTSFHHKIQGRVETLAWHPEIDVLLAFGTSEGRVGYLDSNNPSKAPVLLTHYFKSEIFKVEWGPVPHNNKVFGLYAVSEGKIVVFDVSKRSGEEPILLREDLPLFSFAWKPDYEYVLVSTKTGSLSAYSPDLKRLRNYMFPQRIQEMVWHPDSVRGEEWKNVRIASVTDHKYASVCEMNENDDCKVSVCYQTTGECVNSIAWSPHEPSKILVATDNGIVQIIETRTKEVLSTHVSPNFSGCTSAIWSPINQDFIIIGSKDCMVTIAKVSEHTPKNEWELVAQRKKIMRELVIENQDLLPKGKPPGANEVVVRKNKNVLLPNFPSAGKVTIDELRMVLKWKEKLVSVETPEDNKIGVFDVFGTSESILRLVNINETDHLRNGRGRFNTMLSLFKGDINTTIREAINQKRVDPLMISLAPMVSPKLWQECCEVYAEQLSEQADSNPLEIATHLLACHKTEKAIECLCEAEMFREALVLAKCRYPENDSIVIDVLSKWARHYVHVGNFEMAALCYIVAGKFEDAASVLSRRSSLELLDFAAELAGKSGNSALHDAVVFRYQAFLGAQNENKAPEDACK